jgi:hypothetical protein
MAITSLVLGILSLTCFSVLAGIPALVLGIVAMNRVRGSSGALRGKGLAISGLVTGGLSILFLPLTAAIVLPAVAAARAKAQEAACMLNVRQCVILCQQFASEHDGRLPEKWEDLGVLLPDGEARTHLLTCPSHKNAAGTSYELLGGGRNLSDLTAPSETILVREIDASHRGRRVVGYADTRVVVVSD